jgi:hypothetical protein
MTRDKGQPLLTQQRLYAKITGYQISAPDGDFLFMPLILAYLAFTDNHRETTDGPDA